MWIKWDGQGHFTTLDGHTIVYSGRLTQGMPGVAVWIHRKVAGAHVGYELISDRLMLCDSSRNFGGIDNNRPMSNNVFFAAC